ncbi:unnamed protein product [Effrenium voratum]|nr:unnamed protein product [Effrenium voratum]
MSHSAPIQLLAAASLRFSSHLQKSRENDPQKDELLEFLRQSRMVRLRCLPGLGVHSVHRLGDMDAVATVHLEKGPRRQIVAFLPFEKRLEAKSLLSQFFEMCLAHSNVKAVSDTVREEAEAQGGKWWVQELVEQAIREQEAEEGKEDTAIDADPDRWSELKPDEAEKRGARRLGLDFDPLGPA